jgi:hypothetical protein
MSSYSILDDLPEGINHGSKTIDAGQAALTSADHGFGNERPVGFQPDIADAKKIRIDFTVLGNELCQTIEFSKRDYGRKYKEIAV